MTEPETWPTALHIADQGRALEVSFGTGRVFTLSAELLRVESPSAEVKGHGPGQEQLVFGKLNVFITGAEPIGNYAIRLKFSDGHSTGIFTWSYLEKLGREKLAIWAHYEEKLKKAGRSR
jgi:DUF971 family protein